MKTKAIKIRQCVVTALFITLLLCGVGIPSGNAQTVIPTLLAPPDGYSAAGPGPRMLRLKWETVPEAAAYEVRIKLTTGTFQEYVRFTHHSEMSFGTGQGGTFEWQVRCLYADPEIVCPTRGEMTYGPWSAIWTFKVAAPIGNGGPGPNCPEMEFPREGYGLVDGNNYRFRWAEIPGAHQYQLCIDSPSGTHCRFVDDASWEFRGAGWSGRWHHAEPAEGGYQLRIRAIGQNGPGEWCEPVHFNYSYGGDHGACWGPGTSLQNPPVPQGPGQNSTLNPTPEGLVGVFSWQPVAGAQYYELAFRETSQQGGQNPGGNPEPRMHHGMDSPPSSVLVQGASCPLVIPQARLGARYQWQVRAIVREGDELVPTQLSAGRSFSIGETRTPPQTGQQLQLTSFDQGTSFSGPDAAVPFEWQGEGARQLCQVLVRDMTGNLIAQRYTHRACWQGEIAEPGEYQVQVRRVVNGANGAIQGFGPLSEQRRFRVTSDAVVSGGRRLGDLVNDQQVDSGDAVKALRHSTNPDRERLRVRDIAVGDCNGDGRVDSGDAVQMLRKSVGSKH